MNQRNSSIVKIKSKIIDFANKRQKINWEGGKHSRMGRVYKPVNGFKQEPKIVCVVSN